jgi:hypothetical protein
VIELQFLGSSLDRLAGCEAFALAVREQADRVDAMCKMHLAALATVGAAPEQAND